MPATIIGEQSAVQNKVRRTWTRAGGITTVRTVEGPFVAVEARFNEYAAAGSGSDADEMELDQQGAKGVLTITTFTDSAAGGGGTTDVDNSEWELAFNTIHEPLAENSYFSGAPADQMVAAQKAAEKPAALPESVTNTKAIVYYNCLLAGVTDVLVAAPVVRSCLIVNVRASVRASYSGMFTCLTTASVQSLIPTRYAWRSSIPANYEWLKQPPAVRRLTRGKYEVAQEYWGAKKWLSYFYSGGTGTLPA